MPLGKRRGRERKKGKKTKLKQTINIENMLMVAKGEEVDG